MRAATSRHAEAVRLLAGVWPSQGGRHRAYRALAGALLRAGLPQADVEPLVEALAGETRDEEVSRRVQAVADTAAALRAGKATTGWPALARELGEAGAEALARFRRALGLTVSLADLAEHKRLPLDFLRGLGLHDLPDGAGIPYKDAGGRTVAVKQRRALAAGEGSRWPAGRPLMAYGEDHLAGAVRAGYLTIVEGESDTWTLLYHGEPALGLPGADTVRRALQLGHVAQAQTIYVHREPDAGGEAFVGNVAARLAELGWRGALKVVRLAGAKDPSDLHVQGPEGFKAAWREALGAAEPLALPAAGAQRPQRLIRLPDPYRPFPVEALPDPLRPFVREGAAALGCDPCYLALPALAVAAALIGNARTIRLKRDWHEPSVVWAAIVGDSGTLKSPALKLVVGPVYRLQQELVERFKRECKEYQQAKDDHDRRARQARKDGKPFAEDPPEPPKMVRVVTGDVTIEKLAQLLEDNPRGMFVCRDELGGWLTSFNRYKGKAGGSDLPNWLEMFRAETLVVDRKTGDRPTLFVQHAAVSVCGGIQPGTLARALTPEYFEAGMAARLLMGMPPKHPKRWTEAEVHPETRGAYEGTIRGLLALELSKDEQGEAAPFPLKLTPGAKEAWVAFYGEWARRQAGADGEAAASLSKLEGYAARFALLHHVVSRVAARAARDGGEESDDCDPVERRSVEAGVELAGWFAYEAGRVYAAVRETDQEREVRRLVEFIRSRGGRLTARRLRLSNTSRYPSPEDAEAALDRLAQAGVGGWVELPPGPRGGRPSRALQLNPDTTCFISSETSDEGDEDDGEGGPSPATKRPTKPRPPGENPQESEGFGGNEACSTQHGGPDTAAARPEPPERNGEVSLGGAGEVSLGPGGGPGPRGNGGERAPGGHTTCFTTSETAAGGDGRAAEGRFVDGEGWTLVRDAADLPAVLQAVDESPRVGLDVETVGLDPQRGRVRLLQLATARGVWVLDLFALGDLSLLWGPLAEAAVVCHNATFDLAFLWRLGFRPGRVRDLLVLSRLLTAGTREGNALADLAARELGVTLDKAHQKDDWSAPQLSRAQIDYAARDARVTRDLYDRLAAKVRQAGMGAVADIETRATPAFLWLAVSGAPFDPAGWGALAGEAEGRERALVERLDAMAPAREGCLSGAGAWNWNSDDQVRQCFAALGIRLESTGDEVLAGVDHPLAAALREHRSAAQLVKSFGRKWLDFADGGRIHAGWVPLGTDAGRSACKRPNLQQVPRDARYRQCFRAPEGRVLVKADYSQLQLRIAAKIAKESRMLEAYGRGDDLHALTARTLTGKAEASKDDRRIAKAVNFGLLFGLGAEGLRSYAKREYGLGLTPGQAAEYRRAFFTSYPGLARWHRAAGRSRAKECRSILGRRRLLDEKTPYTHRLNSPVQGSEADGAKQAMALLWERRDQCPGAFPVLFVHDEIVVEADEGQAAEAAAWLHQAMVDGMAGVLDPVPVEVEVKVARAWGG